jgi:hypothetical protein
VKRQGSGGFVDGSPVNEGDLGGVRERLRMGEAVELLLCLLFRPPGSRGNVPDRNNNALTNRSAETKYLGNGQEGGLNRNGPICLAGYLLGTCAQLLDPFMKE